MGKHSTADAISAKAAVRKSKKRGREDSEDEVEDDLAEQGSDAESENEAEIWRAMKASMPKPDMDTLDDEISVDDDEDVSLDMSDSDGEDVTQDMAEEPYTQPTAGSDDDGFEGFDEEPTDLLDSDIDMDIMLGAEDEEVDDAAKTDARKNKKRKLKHLPLFGSAEQYAKLQGGSDDEDI